MASKESAAHKAAAARQTALELRAKQRKAVRRTRILSVIGALALVAVFAVIVAFIVSGSDDKSTPYTVYSSGESKVPTSADDSGGIPVNPEAPVDAVRIDLYSDPICPYCGRFSVATSDEFASLMESGEIALYFHPISFFDNTSMGTHYSTRAASAITTAAEYDPEHFWTFGESLFAGQPLEGEQGLTNDEIAAIARSSGVSEDAIARFVDGEFTEWVASNTDQASVDGVIQTPTMWIAGVPIEPLSIFLMPDGVGVLTDLVAYVNENGTDGLAEYFATLSPAE